MTDIIYLKGDATCPQGKGIKIICHICNDIGGWGRGFVVAISRRWEKPEAEYRAWYVVRRTSTSGWPKSGRHILAHYIALKFQATRSASSAPRRG